MCAFRCVRCLLQAVSVLLAPNLKATCFAQNCNFMVQKLKTLNKHSHGLWSTVGSICFSLSILSPVPSLPLPSPPFPSLPPSLPPSRCLVVARSLALPRDKKQECIIVDTIANAYCIMENKKQDETHEPECSHV